MDKPPFVVSTIINNEAVARTLIDSGNLSYGLIDARFARRHDLPRIPIAPRQIVAVDQITDSYIREVTYVEVDVGGHKQQRIFFYVAPRVEGYDLVLGLPWLEKERVELDIEEGVL